MKSVKRNRLFIKSGRSGLAALLPAVLLAFLAGGTNVLAHGGEDHGDEKPKTETTNKGIVLRTLRLGDLEITIRHLPLEPDTAAAARLFITRYATNEPVDATSLQVAVESSNGSIIEIPTEKGATAGTYVMQIPGLPEGGYSLRATVTSGGTTSTATFSGVEVSHQEVATAGSAASWFQFLLTGGFFLLGFALFAGLVYLAVRVVRHKPLREETVSA